MSTETKKPKWSVVTFKQIDKRREELGLTRTAMASGLGVTNSTYHNWQRGATVPHASQQESLKKLLDSMTASSPPAGPKKGRRSNRSTASTPSGFPLTHPFFPPNGATVPGNDVPGGLARITAAYITSQKEPASAASVITFMETIQKALVPTLSAPVTSEAPVEPQKVDEPVAVAT